MTEPMFPSSTDSKLREPVVEAQQSVVGSDVQTAAALSVTTCP